MNALSGQSAAPQDATSLQGRSGLIENGGTARRLQPAAPERPVLPSFSDLEVVEDAEAGVLWQYMAPRGRPSFTLNLLGEMTATLDYISRRAAFEGACPFEFVVTGSRLPGIYNLGGDLASFMELIRAGDRAGLLHYARACVDGQHRRATNLNLPICTISLVQGDALGGGFECALADDVIIAERSAKFGLPEILFGLFPGMGAYSFLSRRVSPAYAERLILSGRVYSAEEMHEAGIVDVLVEDGEGESGVHDFIRRERRQLRTRRALQRIRERVHPVSHEELVDITEVWVDSALTLGEPELRRMARLAAAQDRRVRD
ncbi:enoyl-CoA hydratase [Spiribacter halobius]|uniref:Enoyl-CoA hydratase n=2 Tax=Sediminicurvatus halobius TaxID=2182432 RepID=A0A2U2N9W6_9GAMM|nr:enoyl-CoA hydratase [Spiribacter halobius]